MNPNDNVRIKPTDSGWQQIVRYVDTFNDNMRKTYPRSKYRMSVPTPDDEGYISDQFWSLMMYFEWKNSCGMELPFVDMQIK